MTCEEMKIGIITSSMDGNRAGIGSYIYNLTRNLLEIDKENEYVLIHKHPTDDPIYREANEITIPFPRIPLRETIGNNIILSFKLRKYKLGIIHDPSQTGPFLFNPSPKKVLTIHDLTPILFPETHGGIHTFLQNNILPRSLKRVDSIIAVSNSTKNDIIRYFKIGEAKVKVIYNGVDEIFQVLHENKVEDVKEKYEIKHPFILYVGTLEPRKNIPTLLKAFYLLKKKGIQHRLVIAGGKGWKYESVYETVNELNLQDEVIFTGYVSDEDLPKLYNAADLFVYPSLYEGFGFPPLEAMACGCPVITSNVSSLPEVAGDAGILVDPLGIDEIADAMWKVLNNEDVRERMVKMGLERAKMFSWEKCAEETIGVYESLVDR